LGPEASCPFFYGDGANGILLLLGGYQEKDLSSQWLGALKMLWFALNIWSYGCKVSHGIDASLIQGLLVTSRTFQGLPYVPRSPTNRPWV
jgi:hypothetical protein